MGRLNLYRKLEMEELDDCIKNSTLKIANFINGVSSKREFIQLLKSGKDEEAVIHAHRGITVGYGFLVKHLQGYLKAKRMMENGEVIYTDLINTDRDN